MYLFFAYRELGCPGFRRNPGGAPKQSIIYYSVQIRCVIKKYCRKMAVKAAAIMKEPQL